MQYTLNRLLVQLIKPALRGFLLLLTQQQDDIKHLSTTYVEKSNPQELSQRCHCTLYYMKSKVMQYEVRIMQLRTLKHRISGLLDVVKHCWGSVTVALRSMKLYAKSWES